MAVARDGALYLHKMIKGNFHHPVFQKYLCAIGKPFFKLSYDECQWEAAITACYSPPWLPLPLPP